MTHFSGVQLVQCVACLCVSAVAVVHASMNKRGQHLMEKSFGPRWVEMQSE